METTYLQYCIMTGQHIGFAFLWLGDDSCDLTIELNKARRYNRKQAFEICNRNPEYTAWPVEYIMKRSSMVLNGQRLNSKLSINQKIKDNVEQ